MTRPPFMDLGKGRNLVRIPILYEDRSVIAIDKPAGWLLVPFSWQRTPRNLQAAIAAAIAAGDFWAKSRNLKFLRHVHRLDKETTGVLLLAKSPGALHTYGDLFESRKMAKQYLAVIAGVPKQPTWTCNAPLAPDPDRIGHMIVDRKKGKEAETSFRLVQTAGAWSLLEARPVTGRTHQIRIHLRHAGHAIVGDELYGPPAKGPRRTPWQERPAFPLGLRAVNLSYFDPFRRKPVRIQAPVEAFLKAFGLDAAGAIR